MDGFQFFAYHSAQDDVSASAVIKDKTIWLTQKTTAELFDCTADSISLHLKNIYADGELSKKATVEEFSIVQQESARVG